MNCPSGRAGTGQVLTRLRLADGIFTATLSAGPNRPLVDLAIDGRSVGVATLEPVGDGVYGLSARLPRQCLSDGDVTVIFRDRISGAWLATYLVTSGYPQAGDVGAELTALRAEFEALKRAFMTEAWHEKLRRADRPLIVADVLEAVSRHLLERDMDRGA